MKLLIRNHSDFDLHQYQKWFEDFYNHCKNQLGFEEECELMLVSDPENQKDPLGKTAFYDPNIKRVVIYVDGRHFKDILRSFSHELIHHSQNCRGDLENVETEEGYAQSDPHMRKMEKEAYLWGNMTFRDWEDHYKKNNQMLTEWLKRKLI